MTRRRIGRRRGIGDATSLLDRLLDALGTETRSKRYTPPSAPRLGTLRTGGTGSAFAIMDDAPVEYWGRRGIGVRRPGDVLHQSPLRELGDIDYSDLVVINELGRQEPAPPGRFGPIMGPRTRNLRGERRIVEARKSLEDRLRHLEYDDLAEIIGEAEQLTGDERGDADIRVEADAFAHSLSFEVHVPGDHYSGMSNQELLEIFIARDRDFTQDTPELREYIADRIVAGYSSTARWDQSKSTRLAEDAIRDAIVERYQRNSAHGAFIKPISAEWRAWKSEHGFDTRVGIMTSQWLSFMKHAEVRISA